MKIQKFWVVTKPTHSSRKDDILFKTDLTGLEFQFKGGLKADDIHGIYTEDYEGTQEAYNAATMLLGRGSEKTQCTFYVQVDPPQRCTNPAVFNGFCKDHKHRYYATEEM